MKMPMRESLWVCIEKGVSRWKNALELPYGRNPAAMGLSLVADGIRDTVVHHTSKTDARVESQDYSGVKQNAKNYSFPKRESLLRKSFSKSAGTSAPTAIYGTSSVFFAL